MVGCNPSDDVVYCDKECGKLLNDNRYYKSQKDPRAVCVKIPKYVKSLQNIRYFFLKIIESEIFQIIFLLSPILVFLIFHLRNFRILKLLYLIFIYIQPFLLYFIYMRTTSASTDFLRLATGKLSSLHYFESPIPPLIIFLLNLLILKFFLKSKLRPTIAYGIFTTCFAWLLLAVYVSTFMVFIPIS
jgi:hypothetical protein